MQCNAKSLGFAQFNVRVLIIYTTVKEPANIQPLPEKNTKNVNNLGDFWHIKSLTLCGMFDFEIKNSLLHVTVEDDKFRRSVCGLCRCLMVGGVKKVKGQKSRVSVL